MNNVKHQPATPLPWEHFRKRLHLVVMASNGQRVAEVRDCTGPAGNTGLDARYIAHAANEYPSLVLCIRMLLDGGDEPMSMRRDRARGLLREIGEAE